MFSSAQRLRNSIQNSRNKLSAYPPLLQELEIQGYICLQASRSWTLHYHPYPIYIAYGNYTRWNIPLRAARVDSRWTLVVHHRTIGKTQELWEPRNAYKRQLDLKHKESSLLSHQNINTQRADTIFYLRAKLHYSKNINSNYWKVCRTPSRVTGRRTTSEHTEWVIRPELIYLPDSKTGFIKIADAKQCYCQDDKDNYLKHNSKLRSDRAKYAIQLQKFILTNIHSIHFWDFFYFFLGFLYKSVLFH